MILGLCATRRRALEEQTTFFAHYYIQYVSDRLNSSSNPEVFMPDDPMALSDKRSLRRSGLFLLTVPF